jgi:tRNA pseudouridine38-40 synthase
VTDPQTSPNTPGRIALGIEYDGSCFNGWQAQKSPTAVTVQETLEKVLSEVADHQVSLICAGRTDTGVHATAQVAHFDSLNLRPGRAWTRGANSMLPATIAIRWSKGMSNEFHARFSATARKYRYVIYNKPVKPAILSHLVSHHYRKLNAELMHKAAQQLLGKNDFSSFRGAGCQANTPIRNIVSLSVTRQRDFVIIEVEANAFLLHMVRNIAGVLLEIGEGEKPVDWAGEVLACRDRTQAGVTALPDGLYLVNVSYPEEFDLPDSDPGPAFLV